MPSATKKKDEELRDWLQKLSNVIAANKALFKTPPPDVGITQTAHSELTQAIDKSSQAETEETTARNALAAAEAAVASTKKQREQSYGEALKSVIPFANQLIGHDDLNKKLERELFDFGLFSEELKDDLLASGQASPSLVQAIGGEGPPVPPTIRWFQAASPGELVHRTSGDSDDNRVYGVQVNQEIVLSWDVLPSQSAVVLWTNVGQSLRGIPRRVGSADSLAYTPKSLPAICTLVASDQTGKNEVSKRVTLEAFTPVDLSLSVAANSGRNVLSWKPADPGRSYLVQAWFEIETVQGNYFDDERPEWRDVILSERSETGGVHSEKAWTKSGRAVRYRIARRPTNGNPDWLTFVQIKCK